MGSLTVRVCNAMRQPLVDQMDVRLVSARTDATVAALTSVRGETAITFNNLIDFQPYIVKVFPVRHRPVAQFATPRPGAAVEVQLYSPIDPARVSAVRFPEYEATPAELRRVLDVSTLEGSAATGAALYAALVDTQRAGLFNLFAKMSSFGFDEHRTVWTFVDRLYRIRADRVFADVQPALRDMVKDAVVTERFHEAPAKLHTPPLGFGHAGSFKSADRYGNLQLTFFVSQAAPLAFKVDADIDDAAGLGHAFQVIRNFATHGSTHPYDIHEILVFSQELALPYELA
jgi:hypothetical protein